MFKPVNFRKWWPVILFVVSSVVSSIAGFATIKANVSDNSQDIKVTAKKVDNHESRISRMEEAYSQLPEMRQDIKQILKEINKK